MHGVQARDARGGVAGDKAKGDSAACAEGAECLGARGERHAVQGGGLHLLDDAVRGGALARGPGGDDSEEVLVARNADWGRGLRRVGSVWRIRG